MTDVQRAHWAVVHLWDLVQSLMQAQDGNLRQYAGMLAGKRRRLLTWLEKRGVCHRCGRTQHAGDCLPADAQGGAP